MCSSIDKANAASKQLLSSNDCISEEEILMRLELEEKPPDYPGEVLPGTPRTNSEGKIPLYVSSKSLESLKIRFADLRLAPHLKINQRIHPDGPILHVCLG